MLISDDHTELSSNVLFMAVCEHHLSRKLLLPVTMWSGQKWMLVGGEGGGIEMAVKVLHQYQVMSLCVLTPQRPRGHDLPSVPLRSHSFHFHKDQ